MSLPNSPVMTKFFSNKIESSHQEWRAYLLDIANVFSVFDNEPYDRTLLEERFEAISGRSVDALRDASNFRDEFGAYGSYLGVFRMELIDGTWRMILSDIARQFLCSIEPDVSAFCTLQLALFQYPNGIGCAMQRNGHLRIQSNIRKDTEKEISNNIRLAPFRLVCRSIIALHEIMQMPLDRVELSYKTIFKLFNDTDINSCYQPTYEILATTIASYVDGVEPNWVSTGLTNFKRNFHILEQTGLLTRTRTGIKLMGDIDSSYKRIKAISKIDMSFKAFEPLYNRHFSKSTFESILSSQSWGKYFDGVSLPLYVIQNIAGSLRTENLYELENEPFIASNLPITSPTFPALTGYEYHERAQYAVDNTHFIDVQAATISREKANREHERIIQILNANLLLQGVTPSNNVFIDLYAEVSDTDFLFEVKTTTKTNYLSQIRKGISQLYEYRFRLNQPEAKLCLVLQNKPHDAWIIDYLVSDRGIFVFWLVDDIRFECPICCSETLRPLNIVNAEFEDDIHTI